MHYVLGSKSTTKNLHKTAKLSQLVEDSRKKKRQNIQFSNNKQCALEKSDR